MLHLTPLAFLLLQPSVLGAACPVVTQQTALVGQSNLNESYLKPKFGQSKANIDSYTEKTINNLIAGVDASLGQFKWENPWFFWPSANGWTSIAKYDHDRGTRKFYDAVSKSNDALAKSNQGCGSNKAALVNCFNDDAGWAGLASLEAYEAYGDQKFLDRAIGVWQVSAGTDRYDGMCGDELRLSTSRTTGWSRRRSSTTDISKGPRTPMSKYKRLVMAKSISAESVSIE